MITIWKYEIPYTVEFTIEMPTQAKILCVQIQGNTPMIWAIVNTENIMVCRKFSIFGTGQPGIILEAKDYIGTFQMLGVWHLFVEQEGK